MARKTIDVIIDGTGRDAGKTYVLTEMSAFQAESWALRAFLALTKSNLDIPQSVIDSGVPGLLQLGQSIGIQGLAGLDYRLVEPLLAEMMECVTVRAPGAPMMPRKLFEGDIEDVSTIMTLRNAIIELHTGFSVAGALSHLQTSLESAAAENSSDTQISRH